MIHLPKSYYFCLPLNYIAIPNLAASSLENKTSDTILLLLHPSELHCSTNLSC